MPLDAIIPYIYICDETTARDFKQLTDAKIKGIISLTGEIAFPNSIFKYFNFGIMDKLTQDISITIKQTNEIIDKIVEVNPHKIGTFSPGSHIPVVKESSDDLPDYYLMLSHNFEKEIISKNKENILRLYSLHVSKTGRRIPTLSKKEIVDFTKISKKNTLSFLLPKKPGDNGDLGSADIKLYAKLSVLGELFIQ